MLRLKEVLVRIGEGLFLVAVALLIVRNNSYPWLVKRSSDVLLLLSFSIVALVLTLSREWRAFIEKTKDVLQGIVLVILGLVVASLSSYALYGTHVDSGGILEFARFLEVGILVLLIGFFQERDRESYKKVALSQLSTLLYFPFLFVSSAMLDPTMYRFQAFENWPSNVGYYVLISMSLALVFFFKKLKEWKKEAALFYILAAGFMSVLLWSQSRASLVGLGVSFLVILSAFLLKMKTNESPGGFALPRVLFAVVAVFFFLSLFIVGFLLLSSPIKNTVLVRLFPQLQPSGMVPVEWYNAASTPQLLRSIAAERLSPYPQDPSRLYVWKFYGREFLSQPLGSGVNYRLAVYQGSPKGPHNTFLEMLVMAGPFGLIGFLYLVWRALKTTVHKIKAGGNFAWPLYVGAALVALLVASFFDDMSTFRAFWLILGLGIFTA